MAKPWERDPIAGDAAAPWANDPIETGPAQEQKASAGFTPPPSARGAVDDIIRSAAPSLAESAIGLAGLPGDFGGGQSGGYIGKLVRGGLRMAGLNVPSEENAAAAQAKALGGPDISAPTGQTIQSGVEKVTGPFYQAETVPGQYTSAVLRNAPSALFPGGIGAKVAQTVVPAVAGETVKQAGGGPLAQAAASIVGGVGVTRTQQALAQRAAAKTIPEIEDLRAAATQNYTDAANLGVTLAPTAVSKGMGNIRTDLSNKFGAPVAQDLAVSKLLAPLETANAPRAAGPLAAMTGVAPAARGPVSIDEIKHLREQLGTVAQGNNATERAAARMAQEKLDDFLANVSKNDVLSGDAQQAAGLFKSARGNWAAMRRAETIAGRTELADLNAATAGSGANVDNSTRQAIKALIRPDMKGAIRAQKMGFSPEEIAQMNLVARGTKTSNALRYAGNLLGGGGGLGQAVIGGAAGVAAYEGHPEYLPMVLAGKGAKALSGKLSQKQVNRLDQMVRSRAPAAPQITSPVQPLSVFAGGKYALPGILAEPQPQQRQLLLGN